MNDDVLEALLMYCLDELEAGVPAEELLARYPEQADVIRPLLETAAQLTLLAPEPLPQSQSASQAVFLAHAKAIKKANQRPRLAASGWRRLVFVLGMVALLFVAFLAASEQTAAALPGSAFYPVKRAAEDLRLGLTNDEQVREALRARFAAERVREIDILLAVGRAAQVECRGFVDAIGPENWVLCGLTAVVNDRTMIEGDPVVGAAVWVTGVTGNGRLTTTRIVVLPEGEAPLLPTATPTETHTVMPADTSTPTPTAIDTPTATSTRTSRPTGTPTPAPTTPSPTFTAVSVIETPTPSVTPTAPPPVATETPEPDDNGNDNNNGNDNDNDNGNDNDNDNDNDNKNDNSSLDGTGEPVAAAILILASQGI